MALVSGSSREPIPAAGITALRIVAMGQDYQSHDTDPVRRRSLKCARMSWLKRQVSRSAPQAAAEPMSAAQFKLRLAKSYLDAMFRPWFLDQDEEHGLLLAGPNAFHRLPRLLRERPGPRARAAGLRHRERRRNRDPRSGLRPGPGPDVNTSVRRGVDTWADTTARAVIGMFQGPHNAVGKTFGPDHPHGVPGWSVSAASSAAGVRATSTKRTRTGSFGTRRGRSSLPT